MDTLLARLTLDDLIEPDGVVTSFSREGERLDMTIELRDNETNEVVELWAVSCGTFEEYRFDHAPGLIAGFGATHSAVKQFVDRHIDMYFTGRPGSAAEMLARLEQAHERIAGRWIPLERYFRASRSTLHAGFGKAFSGPSFLADGYRTILESEGLQISIFDRYTPLPRPDLHLFVVGDSFVIGEDFASSLKRTPDHG